MAALLPIVLIGIVGSSVTVPFVAMGPGPTFDTLGEVEAGDGEVVDVVDIEGVDTDPTTGNLNMTTVAVRDQLNVFEAVGLWLSGRQGLVPRSEVYPPGRTREEITQRNTAEFTQSEVDAEVAALRQLGEPTAVEVAAVAEDGPAGDALREGDRIVAVAGTPVGTAAQVQEAVAARAPGQSLTVDVVRGDEPVAVDIELGARPDDPESGFLGVTPREVSDAPFDIEFNLADIGGPSAGLIFALAVVEKLTPGDLNNGDFVAGTGTIRPDGTVGPIGGIRYKLVAANEAGATSFLVPSANCDEARLDAPDGLELVRVETLQGAVDALEAQGRGEPVPTCG